MYDAKQLTQIMEQIAPRKSIRESTEDMRVVTTVGALHQAVRAVMAAEAKSYNYAPQQRGHHGGKGPNSYPPKFKAEIVERLPFCYNDAALAKEVGISPRTISRWRKQYGMLREDDQITQVAAGLDAGFGFGDMEEGELA